MLHDEPPNQDDVPSRSERRREALATLALAEQLAGLSVATIGKLDLPDDVREEVAHVRSMTAHGARKRELAYLAKLMRRHDAAAFAPLRALLGADPVRRGQDAAAFQRMEALRDKLVEGEADALTALIARCPQVDRQHLNALIRQARSERDRGKPPHAARELFRLLKALGTAETP